MRAYEIILEAEGLWYHGSGMDFDVFDTNANKINRCQNPSGVYLTNDQSEAEEYASGLFSVDSSNDNKNGIVYVVNITAKHPYIKYESEITDNMCAIYADYLKKHFNYGDDWIDDNIIPSYKKDGTFKDIPGSVKTKIMQAGGYDSWKDGRHLAVFDTSDIKIVKKYKVTRNIT